jgi:hypothetical protein
MSVFDKTENILLLRGASTGDGESLPADGAFMQAGLHIDFMRNFLRFPGRCGEKFLRERR